MTMRWFVSCSLVVQCCLLTGGAAAKDPPVGTLDGEPIDPGTTIEVPAGSVKSLVLNNGARAMLRSGTSAIASPPQWYPPEKGTKSIHGSRIYLKDGEITVSLPTDSAKPTAVSVATSNGQTMLLWHGVTRVIARDGDMSVAVDEGAVYVGSQDQWLRLFAGSAALLPKKAPPQLYKNRLVAPETTSCSDGGVGLGMGSEKVPVRVCWKAVAGATAYRVEVASDSEMKQVLESLEVPSTALTAEPRLGSGAYYARVLALGADAFPSLASAPRAVHVARATISSGAVVAKDGAIVMAKDGSVAVDTAGLTVVSAGGHDLSSALANALATTPIAQPAKSFGLDGSRARVIRLRDATGGEARLSLILRELRARIGMTPLRARWPQDPIDVNVVLDDTSKRVDLATEPVTLEVAIDSKVVPVTWTRTGSSFHTRITPIDGPGPFFVRVVAKDQAGAEIGSYVVDIDGRRPINDLEKALKERKK